MKHLVLIATIWTALIVALATAESKALAQSKAIMDAGRPTSEPEGFTGPTTATLSAVDEAKIRAAGIRKLESRRLVLYTDLPSSPEIDELPQVFDRAFDAWCRYFGIDAARHANWRMRASLVDVPSRFESAGLIPADLPKFLNGYTRGMECWVNNQTSPYYRRHLLLHEGVHGFMFSMFGTHAPPWYMEGMAEMLATHRWQSGQLELPYFPRAREEVPKLGRIDIVQTDFANRHAKQLVDILAYDSPAYAKVEPYGWSWAAVAFLDNHPRYRERFRRLVSLLKKPNDFNDDFWAAFGDDVPRLREEWQVFVADIDYGYDFDRTAIDFTPGKPAKLGATKVSIKADQGWQNTGVLLEAGKSYKLQASGRYQVANQPVPWISEPGGVSIHYIHGKPLGILLAAVRPEQSTNRISAFLKPTVVSLGTTITPQESGTLYLKINDSAGELADNSGQVDVKITGD